MRPGFARGIAIVIVIGATQAFAATRLDCNRVLSLESASKLLGAVVKADKPQGAGCLYVADDGRALTFDVSKADAGYLAVMRKRFPHAKYQREIPGIGDEAFVVDVYDNPTVYSRKGPRFVTVSTYSVRPLTQANRIAFTIAQLEAVARALIDSP